MDFVGIKSKDYLKGLKWSLMPKNSIDTIKGTYIPNTVSEDEKEIVSTTIKKVMIGSTEVTLPIDETTSSYQVTNRGINNARYMSKSGTAITYEYIESADCSIGAIYGVVTLTLKSETPVVAGARVEVTLSGITKSTGHNSISYANLDASSMSSLYNLVKDCAATDFSGNSVGQNYSSGKCSINPFLKEAVDNGVKVSNDQVYVQWDIAHSSTLTTSTDAGNSSGWNAYQQSGASTAKGSQSENVLWYYRSNANIVQEFVQLDQYTFRVTLQVPLKILGGGKARAIVYHTTTGGDFWYTAGDTIDTFIFMDLIKEINVSIYGRAINTDTINFGYSLDAQNNLTPVLKNLNVFNFIENELVTLSTFWGSNPWITYMSKYILSEYIKGKYIVEFDMYLQNALSKNIKVNSPLKIYQLNGLPIRRDNRDVIFFVKTIEKQLNSKGYTFHIKALEGSSTNIDDMYVSLVYKRKIELGEGIEMYEKYLADKIGAGGILLPGDSESIYSNDLYTYGYSIALTSSTLKVEEKLLLPGNRIEKQVAIVMRVTGDIYVGDDLKLGLINTEGEKVYDEHCEFIKIPNTNDYLWVGMINLNDLRSNLSFYAYLSYIPETQLAFCIYNLYNYNVTRKEVLSWLLEHHKEPIFE